MADISIKGEITDRLTASFSAGTNLSSFFYGKSFDEAYTGVNLKFNIK